MTLYKWKDISSFGLFPKPGDESEFLPYGLDFELIEKDGVYTNSWTDEKIEVKAGDLVINKEIFADDDDDAIQFCNQIKNMTNLKFSIPYSTGCCDWCVAYGEIFVLKPSEE